MPETLLPIAFTASSSSFWRLPVTKTYAPSLTKSFAVANPIPSVPPVTTAVLPSSFLGIVFPCSCRVLTNFPGSDTFVLMGVRGLLRIRGEADDEQSRRHDLRHPNVKWLEFRV